MAPTKRRSLGLDHVLSIAAIAISTLVALAVLVLTLMADEVDQRRQAVDEGTQTEAAFIEACLAYETFVIDQYRAGLTESQIQELVPVGLLVLQTGFYQNAQTCPSVDEIVAALDTPPRPR